MNNQTFFKSGFDLIIFLIIFIYPVISIFLDSIFNVISTNKKILQQQKQVLVQQKKEELKNPEQNLIETEFESASQQVKKIKNLSNDQQLQFYAYFKQSTVGDCNKGKPSVLDFVESKKWESWNNLKGLSQFEAKKQYIELLKSLLQQNQGEVNNYNKEDDEDEIDLDNNTEQKYTAKKDGSGGLGVSVSRVKEEFVDKINEQQSQQYLVNTSQEKQTEIKNFFSLIDKNDIEQLKSKLNSNYDVTQLNLAGVAPIHYCVDNENYEVLKLLIPYYQKNINIPDRQGMTPLHYAVLIENEEIIEILLQNQADPYIADNNGEDSYTTASEDIKNFIDEYIKNK